MGTRQVLQWMGLTQRAKDLIRGETVDVEITTIRRYPDGREILVLSKEKEFNILRQKSARKVQNPFSGVDYSLYDFIFPSGRVLEEHVQAQPWSSGPVVFIALKEKDDWIPESLWSEDEIQEYLQE